MQKKPSRLTPGAGPGPPVGGVIVLAALARSGRGEVSRDGWGLIEAGPLAVGAKIAFAVLHPIKRLITVREHLYLASLAGVTNLRAGAILAQALGEKGVRGRELRVTLQHRAIKGGGHAGSVLAATVGGANRLHGLRHLDSDLYQAANQGQGQGQD